jgi:hypothetical protein
MSITRRSSTHTTSTEPSQEHHCSCTQHQEQHKFLHSITQTPSAKPWWWIEARPSSGGEGQVISSKSRRSRTSPGAESGGEGKQEASHHHQQATAADSNTFAAQLQAPGRIDNLIAPHGWAWVSYRKTLSLAKCCFAKLIIGNHVKKPNKHTSEYTLHWHILEIITSQSSLCWAHVLLDMHLKHTRPAIIITQTCKAPHYLT